MDLPSDQVFRFIIQQTAALQHHLGGEIGARPLVLPNGKFFPDKFTGDLASLKRLLRRLQEHAGLSDVPVQVRVIGGPEESAEGHTCQCQGGGSGSGKCDGQGCDGNDHDGKTCEGCDGSCHHRESGSASTAAARSAQQCGTGCGTGCGPAPEDVMGDQPRLIDLGDGWRMQVPITELLQPLVLTCNLARALGYVFLLETRSASHPKYENMDAAADLAATLLGFGSLLLSGSHVYSKSCGGPRIRRVTALGCGELALATVLFARRQQHALGPMLKELEVTQTAAVGDAEHWLKERPSIVEHFMTDPERLARGDFSTKKCKTGLFSRWFSRQDRRAELDPESSLQELEAMLAEAPLAAKGTKTTKRDPRADDLRSLVEEALAESGSSTQ